MLWSLDDDVALCRAWLAVADDPTRGRERRGRAFWLAVVRTCHQQPRLQQRSMSAIRSRICFLQPLVRDFNGCLVAAMRDHAGAGYEGILAIAQDAYTKRRGKPFSMLHCWEVLRQHEDFAETVSSDPQGSAPALLDPRPRAPRPVRRRPQPSSSAVDADDPSASPPSHDDDDDDSEFEIARRSHAQLSRRDVHIDSDDFEMPVRTTRSHVGHVGHVGHGSPFARRDHDEDDDEEEEEEEEAAQQQYHPMRRGDESDHDSDHEIPRANPRKRMATMFEFWQDMTATYVAVEKRRVMYEAKRYDVAIRRSTLEAERLQTEITQQSVQAAKNKALARKELRDSGVPESEINALLPLH